MLWYYEIGAEMAKTAKRGRPLKGDTHKTPAYSLRLEKNFRTELQQTADVDNIPLSELVLELLRLGLAAQRDRERSNPTRALCFLIAELAETIRPRGMPALEWHAHPFMFETLKVGVPQLMDAFRPTGEVRSPVEENPRIPHGPGFGP